MKILGEKFGKFSGCLPSLLLFFIFLNWVIGDLSGLSKTLFFYTNYILCALMIPVLSPLKKWLFINKRLDRKIGDLSYPIYLFHYQIGVVVIAVLDGIGYELVRPDRLSLMLVSIPFIMLVSYLVAFAVERPIEVIRTGVKKMKT